MVRALRSGIICCVAGVTSSWSSGEACGVALGTGRGSMNTGKREVCGSVVKVRVQPVIRVVAHGAINGVLLGLMIFCSVVLNLVTGDTIRWGIQYSSFVAGRALGNSRMSTGQLKSSGGVVKGRWLPSGRSMASLALNG